MMYGIIYLLWYDLRILVYAVWSVDTTQCVTTQRRVGSAMLISFGVFASGSSSLSHRQVYHYMTGQTGLGYCTTGGTP